MDQVNVRIDGDIASMLKVGADRSGMTMSAYLNEVLRRALQEDRGIRPTYIPPGRTLEAKQAFKAASGQNQRFVWIFRDLFQPVLWMLSGTLENGHNDLFVVVQPPGGRSFSIPLDNLVAWPPYANDHERLILMHEWHATGAMPHPWNTEVFRPFNVVR